MERRIEYAFGDDGTGFWEKFFLCGSLHLNDLIIYLFTERQMALLWNWWDGKINSGNENIRTNLNFSRQKQFRTLMRTPDERRVEKVRACYTKHGIGNKYELKRVIFGRTPGVKMSNKYVDFFHEKFNGEAPGKAFTDDDVRKDTIIGLLAIRPKIEHEFRCSIKKDNKWLRYFSPKLHFEHKNIDFCSDLNDNCPWRPLTE